MSIISIIQDFICAALPFPIIYKLKVPRRQRIAIIVIFVFAFAACIIAGMYAIGVPTRSQLTLLLVVRVNYIFLALVYTGDVAWSTLR